MIHLIMKIKEDLVHYQWEKKQLVQKIITKFAVIRPKPYAVKIQKDENENKNKDFKKSKQSTSKNVHDFDNFIKCVNDIDNTRNIKGQANFGKEKYQVFSVKNNNIAMNNGDGKEILVDNETRTYFLEQKTYIKYFEEKSYFSSLLH